MFKFLETRKDRVIKKVEHLTKIMPLSGTAPSHAVSDFHFRNCRFASLPLFIAKGIFGMFMGLYNRRQQACLKEEMRSTLAEQRRLIQMLRVRHEETMDPIQKRLQGIQYKLRPCQRLHPLDPSPQLQERDHRRTGSHHFCRPTSATPPTFATTSFRRPTL